MDIRVNIDCQRALDRRTLLRGAGVALAVTWLSAMHAAFGASAAAAPPRRFVAVTLGLGLVADNLNPKQAGRGYEPSRYLEPLGDLRAQLTVISGASHPGVSGGHRAEASLLTAAPMSAAAQSRNTISLDQLLAKHLGGRTRFPSLVLGLTGSNSPSYTDQGSMIPAEESPARLFTRLFVADSPAERKIQAARAREGQSIMDLVADDTRALERRLGPGDRDRLDAYLTSVRQLEQRLMASEAWVNRPKPKVDITKPVDVGDPNDFVGRQRLMSDMVRLALVTDSTRFVTLHLGGGGGVVPIEGVHEGGGAGGTVLDRTTVLLTSNLGNASSHDNRNLPVLLAGGGFRHGSHLAFDPKRNHPLPNLDVSILRQTGLEAESFATSTGAMPGIEPA